MKSLAIIVLAACVALAGCATNPTSATAKFPLMGTPQRATVVSPAFVSLTESLVIRNQVSKKPVRADGYLAIADALAVLQTTLGTGEITEAAIRDFVARHSEKLGPGDDEIVVGLLLEVRNEFLATYGTTTVLLSDPQVAVWLASIERGIRSGVAAGLAANAK
jgi:hypothetical protein